MNFWNNFAAKHPAAAKWVREGGLFVIVSNLITVFKYLLLQFLPKAFASLPVVDFGWPGIDITLFGETFKWNILGYDAAHGSLMAKLNVEGSRRMPALAKELDFAYDQCGSLVVCLSEQDRPNLVKLYENGVDNGVEGLRIIERDELVKMEPNVSDNAVAALWAPTGGIVCPFGLTYAFAENAAKNGVKFQFDTIVTGFAPIEGGWRVDQLELPN